MDPNLTGKTIAELRKRAQLTQSQLSEKLGVSDKAVSKWERGLSCPDISLLNKLSIILDTDIESILYGYEVKNVWKGILVLDDSIESDIIIYDKPLLNYLLSQFLLVGIKDIIIVGRPGFISIPGIEIEVFNDLQKVNQRFSKNMFVIYGNYFLYGQNLTKHFKRAMSRKDDLTVIAAMSGKGDYGLLVNSDKKAIIADVKNSNKYFALPYFFIHGNCLIDWRSSVKELLKNKRLNAETMVRGMASFHINNYDKALQMGAFVKIMQEITGERVGCVEELAIRRGLTGYKEAIKTCDSDTRQYLRDLFE